MTSNPFATGFGPTATRVFQDGTENRQNPALRKTKRDDIPNVPQTKRAALGTITNQRIQPFRAAKQVTTTDVFGGCTQNENLPNKQAGKAFAIPGLSVQSQGFNIHVDDEIQKPTYTQLQTRDIHSTSGLKLHDAVTALDRPGLPSMPILIDDSTDSPMVLDTSIECEREQAPIDRDLIIHTVPEYSAEIYTYIREAEERNRPKPGYMKKQPDITTSMRSILMDWLVEVAEEYKLHRETLFLAVNYIDRFLSQMSVLRGKLQLVGAASMFLAAKYEEIYPPDVGEFVYITDDTYTKKQVLRMEHLILKVLSFDVAVPTVNCFLERQLKLSKAEEEASSLAFYLSELTLVEADPYLRFLPSQLAAACQCLANITLGNQPWSQTNFEVTGYQVEDFAECLHHLYNSMCKAPSHAQQAVREKYKTAKYHNVSQLNPPASLPAFL